MRNLRALLLLPLLLWAGLASAQVGPANAILCNNYAYANAIATATTTAFTRADTGATLLGVAGQRINICGWHATGAGSFDLVQGTSGTPCGTPVEMTAILSVTASAPSADHIEFATFSASAGNQVCVTTSGTVTAFSIMIFYSQF